MNRFREILRRTNERIELPQPVRSRILLEIAADLGDIYDECIERGMSAEEAERKAIELCDLSEEALTDLVRVHETPLRRFLGSLSDQARTRWERIMFTVLILFIAVYSGRELVTTRLFSTAGPLVWPVVTAAFYALIMTLVNMYRLYIRKDYDPRRLRSGPVGILAAGCVCLLIGFAGLSFEFYRTAQAIMTDTSGALGYIVEWGLSTSAMMMVALLAAIAAGIAWFILDNRARMIEAAETAWLFEKETQENKEK
jgi:hypothetical protein